MLENEDIKLDEKTRKETLQSLRNILSEEENNINETPTLKEQTDSLLEKNNEVEVNLPESKLFIPVKPLPRKKIEDPYKTPEGLEKLSYNLLDRKDVTKKNLMNNADWEADAIYF